MFGGILYVTVRINWQLALVAIAVAPVLIAIARVYARRLRAHWHAAETFESRGLSVVQETLGALRVVNAFGQEQREAARFAERAADGSRTRLRLAFTQGGLALLVGLTTAIGTAVVLFVGVSQVNSRCDHPGRAAAGDGVPDAAVSTLRGHGQEGGRSSAGVRRA